MCCGSFAPLVFSFSALAAASLLLCSGYLTKQLHKQGFNIGLTTSQSVPSFKLDDDGEQNEIKFQLLWDRRTRWDPCLGLNYHLLTPRDASTVGLKKTL